VFGQSPKAAYTVCSDSAGRSPGLFSCDPVSSLWAFDHQQSLAAMR